MFDVLFKCLSRFSIHEHQTLAVRANKCDWIHYLNSSPPTFCFLGGQNDESASERELLLGVRGGFKLRLGLRAIEPEHIRRGKVTRAQSKRVRRSHSVTWDISGNVFYCFNAAELGFEMSAMLCYAHGICMTSSLSYSDDFEMLDPCFYVWVFRFGICWRPSHCLLAATLASGTTTSSASSTSAASTTCARSALSSASPAW